MKRIIPFVAAVLVALSSQAQTVNVNLANGQTVTYNAGNVTDITFTERIAKPSADDPERFREVDLGLPSGNKWASHNIGAKKYNEPGYHFAWGETSPSGDYGWSHYMWGGFDANNKVYISKYSNSGATCTLEPADDAATANWGDEWCIPTEKDFEELIYNTTIRKDIDEATGDLKGLYFVSKDGSGKQIYLPAAGYYDGKHLIWNQTDAFVYWTSQSFDDGHPEYACHFAVNPSELSIDAEHFFNDRRCFGLPIRPVKHKKQQ